MYELQTPIKGLSKSPVFTLPVAYKRLRWGARSTPFLIILLLIEYTPFFTLTCCPYFKPPVVYCQSSCITRCDIIQYLNLSSRVIYEFSLHFLLLQDYVFS